MANTGGSNVQLAAYQVQTGVDVTSTFGLMGWGAGTWSRGAWNSRATADVVQSELSAFVARMIPLVRNFSLLYTRWACIFIGMHMWRLLRKGACIYQVLTNASKTPPTVAKQVMVSDVDRHVIAFGCNPVGSNVQDPFLIRFSDLTEKLLLDWRPWTTNTAGDLRIGSGTAIVQAVETRQEILVFTDQALHSMQFIGPPYFWYY